ncbi:MAG: hypothetical protein ABSG46_05815 [Candidatus Binataceae bacterium]|jgi:hypothetical protein
MKKALFGLAKSESQATSIIDQLKVAGFSGSDISALLPDGTATRHFAHVQHTKALAGVGAGGACGLAAGAALGWLVAIGTLAVPELHALVAAGPIIAALAAAAGGAVIGGLIGLVIGLGIPGFEALQYNSKMEGGNILISVLTQDRAERERVKGIFKNAGAVTAAEHVVDHAHGKPSPSAPVV